MTKNNRITFRAADSDVENLDFIKLHFLKEFPELGEINDSEALRLALRFACLWIKESVGE
jgi:hypothetical protein